MPRKARTDSISKKVSYLQEHNIQAPANMALDKDELIAFHEIIESKPADLWNNADIRQAALLAKQTVLEYRLISQVNELGTQIINERGTPVENSDLRALGTVGSLVKAKRATLGLSSAAKGQTPSDIAKQKMAHQNGKKIRDNKQSLLA